MVLGGLGARSHETRNKLHGEKEGSTAKLTAVTNRSESARGRQSAWRGGRRTTALLRWGGCGFLGSSKCEKGAGKQQGERGRLGSHL